MKIPVESKAFSDVEAIKPWPHLKPRRQSALGRKLMSTLSKRDLKKVNFSYDEVGMEQLAEDEPALFLMNHSSFIDLEIAVYLLKSRPFHIICTNDGLVGKEKLMRWIGCIPTRKFITDIRLVKDMSYVSKHYRSSILMYPEASYSFDGTQTPLPESLGKCIKLLKIPVVMIRTKGAFLRDPLYNALQLRNVDVSAKMEYLLSVEQIEKMSVHEINEILKKNFEYDHFKEQAKNNISVEESFRADGLHRVLYKCCQCGCENEMQGKGIYITCGNCGSTHELTKYGTLQALNGETRFDFVSDWYRWQRECVKEEIISNTYCLDTDVNIKILVDSKSIYDVGDGHLYHGIDGFKLTGCDGELEFTLSPEASYSLYADYFWYEIGDMISIGDTNAQYYCFPKSKCNVAKARLATEELYRYCHLKK